MLTQKMIYKKKFIYLIAGFTLIELMVGVGIVGLLATITIPKLLRYQAKSKTAEAKLALASAYSFEKSYSAEYNTYTTCLGNIGFKPEGLKRYKLRPRHRQCSKSS